MKDLFKKRRQLFLMQTSKYLRYVFNDHFVLVLIFLLGFLMVQYSRLLQHFPSNPWPISLMLLFVSLILLSMGSIATYLEPADKQFLLTKEAELVQHIKRATKRSFLLWVVLQSFLLLILAPIFLKLGLSIADFLAILSFLALMKWFVMQFKAKAFFSQKGLDWNRVIQYEIKRKQSILKFFSLFTTVKGISSTVKRRSYLDVFLILVPKESSKTWSNLYLRAFLRSSDYLALTVRLLFLAILSLLLISNRLVAVGLVLVFDYLLLFQLLALYYHFDYNYLAELYPLTNKLKRDNLKQFLRKLAYVMTLIELLLTFSLQGALLLIGVMIAIIEIYLPYKIKQVVD
ncbi:ABC transporter permease [Streptococcus caballi]|uniref:ABC transporter permease n=1 Tax=Streptococcus caballi TaxID=439220 RepID=UPI00037372A3|nr:ABC transporter permease [Streptococcus caballi]